MVIQMTRNSTVCLTVHIGLLQGNIKVPHYWPLEANRPVNGEFFSRGPVLWESVPMTWLYTASRNRVHNLWDVLYDIPTWSQHHTVRYKTHRTKEDHFHSKYDTTNNSLWPSDAIWRYRSVSTLAQAMACSLKAPSHYLNQFRPVSSL